MLRAFVGTVEPRIVLHRSPTLSRVEEVDGFSGCAGFGHHRNAVGSHDDMIGKTEKREERIVGIVLLPAIENRRGLDPAEEHIGRFLERARARRHEN